MVDKIEFPKPFDYSDLIGKTLEIDAIEEEGTGIDYPVKLIYGVDRENLHVYILKVEVGEKEAHHG